ncbi:MAG: shikimate kinase [Bryobacteraceae bacterium]
MNLKLKRTPGIYLVGFMGSGKTTIGRMLAEDIGWRFADLDDDIEAQQRCSIAQIFKKEGEDEFRRIEHEAILKRMRNVCRGVPIVLALGGGAFTRPNNIELLQNNGIVIWIDTAFAIVKKRVEGGNHRPLARDPEEFELLYHERRALYAKADFRVEVTRDDSRLALADVLKLNLFE